MAKLKIAITGGIGSGKSTVLSYLRENGYTVFSCDELYKEIIISNEYIEKVKALFPSAVKNGVIRRDVLAGIVFKDNKKRQLLNALAHPYIMDRLQTYMDDCRKPIVFAEVPLLFEGNFENLFDKIIYIKRNEDQRKQAVALRDQCKEEEVDKRIKSQFDASSDEGKIRLEKCNAIILENNQSLDNLQEELKKLLINLNT